MKNLREKMMEKMDARLRNEAGAKISKLTARVMVRLPSFYPLRDGATYVTISHALVPDRVRNEIIDTLAERPRTVRGEIAAPDGSMWRWEQR